MALNHNINVHDDDDDDDVDDDDNDENIYHIHKSRACPNTDPWSRW